MAKNRKAKNADADIDLDALIAGVPSVKEVEAKFKASGAQLSKDPEFVAEVLLIRFIHDVRAALENLGWSQAELARRLNKKPQYVSRVLDAERRENMTIATMAEFACALGIELTIQAGDSAQLRQEQQQESQKTSDYRVVNNHISPAAEIVYIELLTSSMCEEEGFRKPQKPMVQFVEPEVSSVCNLGA